MPLPDTLVELQLAGYILKNTGRCSGCDAKLFWFLTPKNRSMPFSLKAELMVGKDTIYNAVSQVRYEPHFVSCPQVQKFRRKR